MGCIDFLVTVYQSCAIFIPLPEWNYGTLHDERISTIA